MLLSCGAEVDPDLRSGSRGYGMVIEMVQGQRSGGRKVQIEVLRSGIRAISGNTLWAVLPLDAAVGVVFPTPLLGPKGGVLGRSS